MNVLVRIASPHQEGLAGGPYGTFDTVSALLLPNDPNVLFQRERDRDAHDDLYGDAVEQRRREPPLPHGIER